ncbi:enoyl-CoA hydratase-related protein [Conexibacter stalactiti]|uniref:Enoyl-CoA hydratase-related protein n=1 Tax=Conexibacter stalactiti TaxID=1940611 RepID=A0ABU4HUR9_9ACTN|nr:enoyl-CoA hydratase-related protein [Conexibacter stalactiti]MDW5595789.1 enoyl-CoA hydratase-related protein [Conexibacter stalactiti]MEC5036431.1 enoyl-CoA hydratase-related protein [Conexibacter stalactiti]
MIGWEQGEDGIVVLTLDDPARSANTLNGTFTTALGAALERLEAERAGIAGVVLCSAKRTFIAGGDLLDMRASAGSVTDDVALFGRLLDGQLRRLETYGRPVVSAINGAALGGGLEVALATHRRIALDAPETVVGLPEVTLGLLPGGGGVVRTVRLLGVVDALVGVLLEGARHPAREALRIGLVDQLVATREQLLPAAKAWIAANPGARQPWDAPGYRVPGGAAVTAREIERHPALPAGVRRQLAADHYPAPHSIIAAAIDGAGERLERASEIELRAFLGLVGGPTAANMTQACFFDLQQVRARGRRGPVPRTVALIGGAEWTGEAARLLGRAGIEVVAAGSADLVLSDSTGRAPADDRVSLLSHGPLDRAALVELVPGAGVGEAEVDRALALVERLGKLAVVIAGGAGSFVEPVAAALAAERAAMLREGIPAEIVDTAAARAGYALPAALDRTPAAVGASSSAGAIDATGAGAPPPLQELKERLLVAQALTAVRLLDAGVIATAAEASVAAIVGAGFPDWTGGPLRYLESFDGGVEGSTSPRPHWYNRSR